MAVLVLLSESSVSAQQPCGGMRGRVTTEEGYLIPAANIRLANKENKQIKNVQTDGEGEYTICLEAGVYDVLAEAGGFKPVKRKSIKVEASTKNIIDFVLKLGKLN
jgi:hypothetical protein